MPCAHGCVLSYGGCTVCLWGLTHPRRGWAARMEQDSCRDGGGVLVIWRCPAGPKLVHTGGRGRQGVNIAGGWMERVLSVFFETHIPPPPIHLQDTPGPGLRLPPQGAWAPPSSLPLRHLCHAPPGHILWYAGKHTTHTCIHVHRVSHPRT